MVPCPWKQTGSHELFLFVRMAGKQDICILSNNRNLTVVNLPVFLEHQHNFRNLRFTPKSLCFETDKLFFPLNSGEKLGHLNNWKR